MNIGSPTVSSHPAEDASEELLASKNLGETILKLIATKKAGQLDGIMPLAAKGLAEVASIRHSYVLSCFRTEALRKQVSQMKDSYEESSLTLENVRYVSLSALERVAGSHV